MRSFRLPALLAGVAALGFASSLTSCGASGSKTFGNNALVQIVTTTTPAAVTGQENYSLTFEANFPNPPGTFSVTGGTLPPGMALNHITGELNGVPRLEGTYHFQIEAQDGNDPAFPAGRDQTFAADRQSFVLAVGKGEPNLLSQVIPAGVYHQSYSYQLDVAGGTPPYTFTDVSVLPDGLPNGLAVGPTGIIGNLPNSSSGATPYHFRVRVTDSASPTAHFDEQDLQIIVVVPPLIIFSPSPLQPGASVFPYSNQLTLASNGAGAPFVWTQVLKPTPAFPPNTPLDGETLLSDIDMEITPSGVFHNKPGFPGPRAGSPNPLVPYTVLFTVNVIDGLLPTPQSATRQYSFTVNPGPVLSSITPKSAASPGPFLVAGLNFQNGATLTFKPGVGSVTISPVWDSATAMHFNAAPGAPTGAAGAVPVLVTNPDGGNFTLPNGFVFPATNITFGQKGFISDGLSSFGLDCADVTGDGKADIVHCGYAGFVPFSGYPVTSTAGGLRFLKNNGNLTFTTVSLSATSYTACRFVDLDADGDLDIVAVRPGAIDTWFNNGTGTFTFALSTAIPAPPAGITSDISIGKFNGDSIPDITWGSGGNTYGGSLYVALGVGTTGGFSVTTSATSGMGTFYGVNSMATLAVDGDGIDDIVVAPSFYSGTTPFFYRMLMASGGSFGGAWTASNGNTTKSWAGVSCVRAGNFLNTSPAVVCCTVQDPPDSGGGGGCELAIFGGSLLGTKTALSIPVGVTKNIGVADFDFDGVSDFAVSAKICATGSYSSPTGGTCDLVYIYKGKTGAQVGTLNIASGAPTVTFANSGRIASGDLDGDGRPDILISTSFWATDNQNSTYYQRADSADGNGQGIVFYLNSSN